MKRGLKTEKKIAKEFEAKLRPASGARWHSKEDAISTEEGLLIQIKECRLKSFSIKWKTLSELERNSFGEGCVNWIYIISNPILSGGVTDAAIISKNFLTELLDTQKKYNEMIKIIRYD